MGTPRKISASCSLRGLGGAGQWVIPAVGEEAAGRVWGRTLCRKAWNRNLSNAWYFPGLPLPLGLWGPPHIPFPEETGGSQLPTPRRSFQAVAPALRPYCVHYTGPPPLVFPLSEFLPRQPFGICQVKRQKVDIGDSGLQGLCRPGHNALPYNTQTLPSLNQTDIMGQPWEA